MRLLLLLLVSVLPFSMNGQKLHATIFGGFANYYGDLQNKPFTLDQAKGVFGIGAKYDLTNKIAIRSGIMFGKIAATDAKNKAALHFRNLSFQSSIFELNVLGEYTFFDMQERNLSPYVFGGIAMFHFNPYTYDTVGNKHYLKPLSTEGQGLSQFPDRKPYKLTQFAIPFGAGVKFRVTENVVLAYEFGLRKTFTDYLDDVSKTYVSDVALALARGQTAVDLAYRGDELKNGSLIYPAEGDIRGSEKYKDWYYFSGVSVAIGINTGKVGGLFGGGSRKGRLDCPKF